MKIAHYSGHEWEPYRRAVEAAENAGIPVMVDFGGADPVLPLEELFFDVLRPGDIYTHAYGGGMTGHGGRQALVDETGTLRPRMLEAQERGIIFDIGFGGGSFFYEYALPAFEQGLRPNTISTDLHTGSMNGGMPFERRLNPDEYGHVLAGSNRSLHLETCTGDSAGGPRQSK